jgi:hypothetical protein
METDKFSCLPPLHEIKENNRDELKNYLCMNSETSDHLICLVTPHTKKKRNTFMRKTVSDEESLLAKLRFLATGLSVAYGSKILLFYLFLVCEILQKRVKHCLKF